MLYAAVKNPDIIVMGLMNGTFPWILNSGAAGFVIFCNSIMAKFAISSQRAPDHGFGEKKPDFEIKRTIKVMFHAFC